MTWPKVQDPYTNSKLKWVQDPNLKIRQEKVKLVAQSSITIGKLKKHKSEEIKETKVESP